MASLTRMAQQMGRTESTFPSMPVFLTRTLSDTGKCGIQPSRLIARAAALLAMLLRLRGDVGLDDVIEINTRGSPEVARPSNWQEWVALAESENRGNIVFPGVMLETASGDAINACRGAGPAGVFFGWAGGGTRSCASGILVSLPYVCWVSFRNLAALS